MGLLNAIIVILVVIWMTGFALRLVGGLIHIFLIAAVFLLIYRFLKGRAV